MHNNSLNCFCQHFICAFRFLCYCFGTATVTTLSRIFFFFFCILARLTSRAHVGRLLLLTDNSLFFLYSFICLFLSFFSFFLNQPETQVVASIQNLYLFILLIPTFRMHTALFHSAYNYAAKIQIM